MEISAFIQWAVLCIFELFFPGQVNSEDLCRGLKFDDPVHGYALQSHVIANLTLGVNGCCRCRCSIESTCVSFNLGPPINDKWVCQLSNSDHMRNPEDMKPREGFIYRGTENACYSNPCSKNAVCLNGYTDKKYICNCHTGYTGEHCEREINECNDGSHNCDVKADCTNTVGSFTCACKDGYIGDGRFCAGFPFHWTLNGTDRLLTLYNGAFYETIDDRKVLYLNGSSYAETPALPIQTISFSILCWVKILSLPINDINLYSDWSYPYQFRLTLFNGKLEAQLRRSNYSPVVNFRGGSFTVSEWVHVVLTWSRENRIGKLYKNGNKTGEAIADPSLSLDLNPTGSKAFDIGLKGDTGHSFHGYIRDLMVF